jgi:sucrose-6-phosphate hydrolase SacC (GH32 family)
MTWGHAVSKDLTHWEQLDHAIYPDKLGTIFSGSGVVDHANTAGWQTGEEKVLVCIYTSAGAHATPKVPFTQSVAYSNDRGRTWTKYAKNPVLGHIRGSNRDPKVIWHEPTKRWVMALYLSGNDYVLFASKDLKAWTKLCDVKVPGASECPDIFLLPVDSDPKKATWVFWGGNGNYLLGEFDGTTFKFDSGPHKIKWGRNYYAAQTFSDIPAADGRRIQIGWMAGGKYPGMPFNQQMSFPVELTLRTTPKGTRMYFEPVKEIENLRVKTHKWDNLALEPGKNPIEGISGELFDIRAEIEVGKAEEVGFTIRGETVVYKVKDKSLVSLGAAAPLEPVDGKITLQILVDRTSVETFGNAGRRLIANCFLPDLTDREIGLFATGGAAKVVSLRIHELKSAWPAEK